MNDFRNETHNFIAGYEGSSRSVFTYKGKQYVKWNRVPRKGSFEKITIFIDAEKGDCKDTIISECDRIANNLYPKFCFQFKTTTKFQGHEPCSKTYLM